MRIGFEQANAIHNKWESGWGFNVQQSIMGNFRAVTFTKDKWIFFFFLKNHIMLNFKNNSVIKEIVQVYFFWSFTSLQLSGTLSEAFKIYRIFEPQEKQGCINVFLICVNA